MLNPYRRLTDTLAIIPFLMRHNNFDIVRLVLAVIVALVHMCALSNSSSLEVIPRFLSSQLAVEGFFTISGFLIFASYERSNSLKEYCANRAWRILPGYWLSSAVCLLIAFCMGQFHVGGFLLANLSFSNFLHPGIPGVFQSNPGSTAMDGALWTIKTELMFYVSVPLIVWCCRRLQRDAVLWTLFVCSVAFRSLATGHGKWAVQLPGQLSYFMIGALIHYHLPFFKKHARWIISSSLLLYALHAITGWYFPRPAAVGALTLAAALLLPTFRGPTRWGDFSYGTYVLHWPLIQLVVAAGFFQKHPWGGVLLSSLTIAFCSALSWFFVEKPAMAHARSRRLRLAAAGEAANYPPAVP